MQDGQADMQKQLHIRSRVRATWGGRGGGGGGGGEEEGLGGLGSGLDDRAHLHCNSHVSLTKKVSHNIPQQLGYVEVTTLPP